MSIVLFLAPFSLALGLLAVGAFWWTLKADQYDDPDGDAARILIDDPEDRPLGDDAATAPKPFDRDQGQG